MKKNHWYVHKRTDQSKSIAGARPYNSNIKRGVFCLGTDVVSFNTLYSLDSYWFTQNEY
jgi:hypothetical protein